MSTRIRHPRPLIVLIVLLGALLLTGSVALGVTLTKTGRGITALRAVTRDEPANTKSTSYVDVPDMSLSVTVPSNTTALFMIQFSADAACVTTTTILAYACTVRAQVDGVTVGPGPWMTFDQSVTGTYETRSTHWIAGPFTAGPHTVKIQYRASGSTETSWLDNMTLSVLRSKV